MSDRDMKLKIDLTEDERTLIISALKYYGGTQSFLSVYMGCANLAQRIVDIDVANDGPEVDILRTPCEDGTKCRHITKTGKSGVWANGICALCRIGGLPFTGGK